MEQQLRALESSVERLRAVVTALSDAQLEQQAYPTEWRIAEVMSHIGSGAVIMARRLDDGLAGKTIPDDFAPLVWHEWNAKSPREKADDGLTADRVLIDRLHALNDEQKQRFQTSFGPFTVDFARFVGMRLNEHALHTWDIEVALDPLARLHQEQTDLIIDNLQLIGRFTGKPTGSDRTIAVHTSDPERDFTVELAPDAVTFESGASGDAADRLELPAEAFVRLVYGRLDDHHAFPAGDERGALEELRRVFPGP